ncbi:hypothetical protein [Burkholderia vietnamiensis]|uniref:hypothetical protein n=1 Tax=Burkholderia vietnamiensis TaxID=60552 RepID=UPI001CC42FB7|nr:hypothetical protein [Burkholderia vietnamiensis]HDR9086345.1 hypothetical protein [Burkholderia vietnamiensis]
MSEIAVLGGQIKDVQGHVQEIKAGMTQVADAIVRLAVIEERHLTTRARVEKLEDRMVDVSTRTTELEKAHIKYEATFTGATWTAKVGWALLGGGALALAGKLLMMAMTTAPAVGH